jgi:hypothetical protein
MKFIRKALGLIWMVMGPLAVFYLIKTGMHEIAKNPLMETRVQWGVFILVSIPIALGLIIFGYYALKGEYEGMETNAD